MRERGGLHQRLPPAVGKPTTGRESSGYLRPGRTRVRFRPRPYARVRIIDRYLWSLLDPGSEISFIEPATAELARRQGYQLSRTDTHASLADGTAVTITRTATLPITAGRRTVEHEFQVMRASRLPGINWSRPVGPIAYPPAATSGNH